MVFSKAFVVHVNFNWEQRGDSMKKAVVLLTILALVIAFAIGCGQKEAEQTDKVPADVQQAEQMDSTRMDSAMVDSAEVPVETAPADSM